METGKKSSPGYEGPRESAGSEVNTFWLVPLALGAAGAVALAAVTRRLAHELEGLQQAMRPLRSDATSSSGRRRAP